MKSLRFFITTILSTVLVCVFFAGLARQWGLSREYAAHRHPLLERKRPWVIADSSWVEHQRPEDLVRLCTKHPNLFLKLDVQLPPTDPMAPETTPSKFNLKSAVDMDVDNFVRIIGNHCPWIFGLHSNVIGIHTKFQDWTKALGLNNNFAVESTYEVVVKSLKEDQPQLLYVSSFREGTRLSIAAQIGLESVISMNGDVLIINPYFRKRWVLQENLLEEIHRRKKQFCVGPLTDFAKWKELHQKGFDCVLTDAPESFF